MNHSKDIQYYFDKFDEVFYSSGLSQQEKCIEIKIIKKEILRDFSRDNSDYYYFFGYIGYISKEFNNETEVFFRKSLELKPNDSFCQYYYGFYLFDTKRYKEALKIFKNIDLTVFKELGQIWRCFKVKEITLCCTLLSPDHSEDNKIEKIEEFLVVYKDYIKNDENNFNFPINYPLDLIKCVGTLINSFSGNFKPVITDLVKLIEELKLNETYYFEYNQFKHFLQTD